jgi:hypothetical protein
VWAPYWFVVGGAEPRDISGAAIPLDCGWTVS